MMKNFPFPFVIISELLSKKLAECQNNDYNANIEKIILLYALLILLHRLQTAKMFFLLFNFKN